ncbi:MAG: sigma 54-interacting transcriptional regulator [Sandaracinaceae bacterium]|nr:MAG: FHA domain-containing protein [Sandaracinaceae bacterium]
MSQSSWDDPDRWTNDATSAGGWGVEFRRFALVGAGGKAGEVRFESTADRCSIGAHRKNDLALEDPTVSRFHAEVEIRDRGPFVRDLGSRNGTYVDGVRVEGAWLRHGSSLKVGKTLLRFEVLGGTNTVPISRADHFGTMYGASVPMRALFAMLEKIAPSDATVLLEGETGTGKEEAAQSIHEASPRADGPFVTLDCSAIPSNLLESELFGHERGAFTGATESREGVFEAAHGGTLFLDELGELPLTMQPALLRALEQREVRRVGATEVRHVDVRVVAATNRDLREEVSASRFREDLYYRLAVFHLRLPPLRERPEDIPGLAAVLLGRMGLDQGGVDRLLTPELRGTLRQGRWPGNVRELRNHLSRCMVFGETVFGEMAFGESLPRRTHDGAQPSRVDASLPYADARNEALARFERDYAAALLQLHGGNVSAAARAAEMARPYLHRILRKHGLR